MQINGLPDGAGDAGAQRGRAARRHPLVLVLSALLFAECALLAVATGYLLVELLIDVPDSYPAAIALTVLTAIATVWLAAIAVGSLRGRSWIRGAATVWQVLQIAVAIGCFQGAFAQPVIGWWLLLPALAVLALLFTRPVVAHTARHDLGAGPAGQS